MLCIGHRGAMGHAPENTLKSVAKALEMGAPWVEIDVFFVDGHLVVIHDSRLERTTNGNGHVFDKTFSYLRTLDAGDGEKIPTLEEVLDLMAARAGINIELKGPDTAEPVVKLIQKRLGQNWDKKNFIVSSFHHREIAKVKRLDNRIRTGALISGVPLGYAAFAQKLGAYSVHQSIEFVSAEFVTDAHRRGLKVFVYTVNYPKDMERMQALGVDGVFTNYPDRVLNFLGAKPGRYG
jgi:glycerophosphoryl diester phosphodiesterase